MLTKLSHAAAVVAFSLYLGTSSAVNLRNGPKAVSVDLDSSALVGSGASVHDISHARRQLAMRGLADFDWEIQPEPDFPAIGFDGASTDREVRFLYNYTGSTVDPSKEIRHSLLQGDCKSPASAGAIEAFFSQDIQAANEYQLDVNILQETVVDTEEYTDIDVATAMINFCVRVDYFYIDPISGDEEGVNFHETNVTITIDLTANFTLTALNVERIDADAIDEEAALNCDVQAYFCDDDYVKLTDPLFVQGDIMPVCVEIAETDRFLYHLNDVLDMDLTQTKRLDPTVTDTSAVVDNQQAVGLSDKFCRNGICRMRHQLASKFFDERNPNNINIAGVAICAFGPLSAYTRRVNRAYSQAYKDANPGAELDVPAAENVDVCKTTCDADATCLSFSVTPLPTGRVDCTLYRSDYPADEDMVVDASSTIYTRNDPSAIVTVP